MKTFNSYIFFLACIMAISSCKKNKDTPIPEDNTKATTTDLSFSPVQGSPSTFVKIYGSGFGATPANVMVRFNGEAALIKTLDDKTILAVVPAKATTGKISVTVVNQVFTSLTNFTVISKDLSLLTGAWLARAGYPGKRRSGVTAFANASSGYVAVGGSGDFTFRDTWQYLPATNQWVPQTDFPGFRRMSAASFTIGKKAYIVTGFAYFTEGELKDFWEFDTETFVWTKKAGFPGEVRSQAAAFAINNKGYVATGLMGYFSPDLKDMWEYDPVSDKWLKKADIPFTPRFAAAGFSIGNKGYLGLGVKFNGKFEEGLNDWWEYEPATDKWTRKADFPEYITHAFAPFVLNQNGFIFNASQECWRYSPATDKWEQKASFPENTGSAASFVIGNKAYVVQPEKNTLYQFEP